MAGRRGPGDRDSLERIWSRPSAQTPLPCVRASAQHARALTLKREVDVVVPATLTTPREHAPDAGPRGTATEAQVQLEKAEIEPVMLATSSFPLYFDDLDVCMKYNLVLEAAA